MSRAIDSCSIGSPTIEEGIGSSSRAEQPPRRLDVDLLKTLGILTVVLIHSIRSPWDSGITGFELWLGKITRFAVPGFLLASGILYSDRRPDATAVTYRRVIRLLIPYLVASLAAQIFWAIEGRGAQTGSILKDLLLASSFGQYYYVLIALFAVLLVPMLSRLSPAFSAVVASLSIVMQWGFETGKLGFFPLFWAIRNPGLWIGYFLTGWSLESSRSSTLTRLRSPMVRILSAGALLTTLALSAASASGRIELSFLWSHTGTWLGIYATLFVLLSFSYGRRTQSSVIRFLSDGTYTIYLYHLFFVIPLRRWIPAPAETLDPAGIVVPWIAGIVGPILLIVASRQFLGRHSRTFLGT